MARRKTTPERRAELAMREEAEYLKRRRSRAELLNRKIAALQNCEIPLIPKLPFSRLVKEILLTHSHPYRITAVALEALQEACEFYLTFLFSDAYLLTYHRKRVTLDRSDIRMVLYIRQNAQR